jgi:hypothetical protein
MDIKPIVFAVPSVPVRAASKPSLLPWVAMGLMALVLAFVVFRGPRGNGPGPSPTPLVIDATVSSLTEANTKQYLLGVAAVFEDLAAKVETRQIQNATQLQSNSRAATVAVREAAYKEVNALDNERVNGEYAGKEAAVAAYLRSKADGYRRAAK